MSASIIRVLDQYDIRHPDRVQAFGSGGGFSGAQFWRVTVAGREFCLRKWPRGKPGTDHAKLMYTTLQHVQQHTQLPLAFPRTPTRGTDPFVKEGGRQWELSEWLPGKPVREHPINPEKLRAAMQMLATFHNATEHIHHGEGNSRAIEFRCQLIDRLNDGQLDQIRNASSQVDQEIKKKFLDQFRFHGGAIRQQLQAVRHRPDLQFPILGDIWSEHVLFTGDQVTGVIDFDAIKVDRFHLDLARLLGSYEDYSPGSLQSGMEEYSAIRPLGDLDRRLIELFDRAYVLLAGIQWLIWIELEHRTFPDWEAVQQRLERLNRRTPNGL